MELSFNTTEEFEKDLRSLDTATRTEMVDKINRVAQMFSENKAEFAKQVTKPLIKMGNGYNSSLYIVRVAPNIRVVMAVDDDPIFEQVIVTLLRAVKRVKVKEAVNQAAQDLYQPLNGHFAPQEMEVG